MKYFFIFFLLLILELVYFKVADRLNIIDKPNERSSHSSIVLRGGGIIFFLGVWIWSLFFGFKYPWFLASISIVAIISFIDDVKSLPDSIRLFFQFGSMLLMIYQVVGGTNVAYFTWMEIVLIVIISLVVCVGASNVINFMDGINGITAGYSLIVLLPLLLINGMSLNTPFGEFFLPEFLNRSFFIVSIISIAIFSFFNFRPKGKAKCFAGDVGSLSIAFILLFSLGTVVMQTFDVTYFIFLIVYGVDGCLTICHRILLKENLGAAHRKHAYQIMANELNIPHTKVSLIYMGVQLVISLSFIFLCPNSVFAHWVFLSCTFLILSFIYVCFMKKYYHLHEAYLQSLK